MEVRFSRRVPADLSANRISEALARLGPPPFNLTVSNPTACGIAYPEALLAGLADPAALRYRPDPRGVASARAAVADEFARHGVAADPERIVLTASTSEAYSLLFKLLCEPGEAVLAPLPSYPLFEHLARAEAVRVHPYHLDQDAGWRLDPGELAAAGADVRAVIVVHPNNPTGSYVAPDDAAALAALCRSGGRALIADEVFLGYPLDAGADSFAARSDVLTFTLGGLSKSVGLPQLKLAWVAVGGPPAEVSSALARLEFLADSYLSVATPVQLALPALLRDGAAVRAAIAARCRSNLAELRAAVPACPEVTVLPVGGGWSAVLRVPAVIGEEELALTLLGEDGVLVQPGYFFDFPRDGYLVVSLLPPPETLREGVARLLRRVRSLL